MKSDMTKQNNIHIWAAKSFYVEIMARNLNIIDFDPPTHHYVFSYLLLSDIMSG
jgi:hypothetical protein